MAKPSVKIEEWDGDRAVVGGFKLVIKAGEVETEKEFGSYDTEEERNRILSRIRKEGQKAAADLSVKLQESLFH